VPDLWRMADIFLPQEKGALAVHLLGSLFRCIRAEAADLNTLFLFAYFRMT
jgi:hypothetical protein